MYGLNRERRIFNKILYELDRSIRFVVFTVRTMKNVVFWNVTLLALVRTDVSEEFIAPIFRVTRIGC
jgi:hypothetical protein